MKGLIITGAVLLVAIGAFFILGVFLNPESSGIISEVASRLSVDKIDDGTDFNSNQESSSENSGVSGSSGENAIDTFNLNCDEVQIAYSLGNFAKEELCIGDCDSKNVECKSILKNLDYDSSGNFDVGIYLINSTNGLENPVDFAIISQNILPREEQVFSNTFVVSGSQEVECKFKTESVSRKQQC